MEKDNFIVTIESVYGTYREVADRARTTIGLDGGDKVISDEYMRKMYLCEHSPIRIRSFIIKIKNVPSWIATHYVRHHVGVTPFVSTQRDDRNVNINDRDAEPQGNLVTLELYADTQAIINISRKRLCNCAHQRTKNLWKKVLEEIKKIDEPLYNVCVPDCIYRGHCYEFKSCNFHKTESYKKQLQKYRENIN